MEPLQVRNCASWKSRRTKRSIPIENCTRSSYGVYANTSRTDLTTLATCDRYYEGGVSSVYLWELEDGGFAGVVLLKKGGCLLYSLTSLLRIRAFHCGDHASMVLVLTEHPSSDGPLEPG